MNYQKTLEFLGRLDKQELTALQTCALLGNTFSLDHMADLCHIRPSKLLNFIDRLVNLKICKQMNGLRGDYFFSKKEFPRSVLNTIEKEDKKVYCLNIINYLERELPIDEDKALKLAELYLELKKEEGSLQYEKKAADFFTLARNTEKALILYRKIIEQLLTKQVDLFETSLFIDCVLAYVPIAINRCSPKEIFPILRTALEITVKSRNDTARAMIEMCLGRIFQCQGRIREASIHYDEGWRIAKNTGDKEILKALSKLFALSLFWQGRIREAVEIYEETLGNLEEISIDLRDLWAHLMLAFCYGINGRIARGVGLAEAIRQRALSKGYIKGQAFAHAVIAIILIEARHLKDAEPHIDKALEIGERINNDLTLWIAEGCKAYIEYSKGNLEQAKKLTESTMSHMKSMGQTHYPASPFIIEILWALDRSKLDPINGYSFVGETTRLMNWPDIYMKGAALRYHALDKKLFGTDIEKVEEILKQSQTFLKEAGALIELGRTQIELIKLYIEKNDQKQAKDLANVTYQMICEIDKSLFPSDLLSLVEKDKKEIHMYQDIIELRDSIGCFLDHDTFLGKVATLLTDMFGAERAAILMLEKETVNEPLKIIASRNFPPEELQQFNKEPLRDLILSVIDKRDPLIITDFENDRNLSQQNLQIKSIICAPMVIKDEVVGVIYMDNRLLKGSFLKEDIAMITVVATVLSLFHNITNINREPINMNNSQTEPFYPDAIESDLNLPEIIGKTGGLKLSLSKVKKVARTDATVLILGETGVGKELIAHALHQLSHRANNPFIVVNISVLTENLLSSELFGYEKGAFTGAVKTKVGRFEIANGGTIFIDEIGDLSVDSQVKLLRVLQERTFERVGGTQTIHSDFRLIAATNRNLQDKVARGQFRSDLFYRISSFPIELPPLRERKEDIPTLALHFMNKYSRISGKNLKRIDKSDMKKLLEYSWPGNIRELENVIERAVILSEGGTLSTLDIGAHYCSVLEEPLNSGELLPLSEVERKHVISVLNHTKWRIRGKRGAANILALKPSTLEFRMKKLGITRDNR